MNTTLLKYLLFFFGFILLFYLPVAYFRLAHKNRKAQAWAAENAGVKFYIRGNFFVLLLALCAAHVKHFRKLYVYSYCACTVCSTRVRSTSKNIKKT